jgi:hypothetical protein
MLGESGGSRPLEEPATQQEGGNAATAATLLQHRWTPQSTPCLVLHHRRTSKRWLVCLGLSALKPRIDLTPFTRSEDWSWAGLVSAEAFVRSDIHVVPNSLQLAFDRCHIGHGLETL